MSGKKRPPALATSVASSYAASHASSATSSSLKKQLTEEQQAQIKEAFDLFASESSKTINSKELEVTLLALGTSVSKDEIAQLSKQYGIEMDDSINLETFTKIAVNYMYNKSMDDEILEAFKLFDVEKQGKITAQSLRKIALELGEDVTDSLIEDMIAEADSNKTGSVSLEDFIKVIKRTTLY